jgi:hypothetical protein
VLAGLVVPGGFLFDYACCGNTISAPQILGHIAAVPGYLLVIAWTDRIGHRRLQFLGFTRAAAAA